MPGTRRSNRTSPRPSRPAERSTLANLASASRAALLAFGQRDRLAGLEARGPSAAADPGRRRELRLQRRHLRQHALELAARLGIGAGADQQRQVGHLVDRHAVEDDAFGIDQRQPLLVLPQRRGRPLDDVDHQRVGQPARHARVLDPAELQQPLADRGDVDQRLGRLGRAGGLGRAAELVDDDRVDQRAVHPVEADDLVAVDA